MNVDVAAIWYRITEGRNMASIAAEMAVVITEPLANPPEGGPPEDCVTHMPAGLGMSPPTDGTPNDSGLTPQGWSSTSNAPWSGSIQSTIGGTPPQRGWDLHW